MWLLSPNVYINYYEVLGIDSKGEETSSVVIIIGDNLKISTIHLTIYVCTYTKRGIAKIAIR